MSAALHIADNYNNVVDIITSLTAIYERTISVEPTLQQATHKQQRHKQLAYKQAIPFSSTNVSWMQRLRIIRLTGSLQQLNTYHFTIFRS
jgi:hypothetical protein